MNEIGTGRKRREGVDEKENRYSCNECDYKTNLSLNLRQHRLIHGKEKTFSCDQCSFAARQPPALWHHKLRHKGEKRYCCNECNYKTKILSSLKKHNLIHGEEKPFGCDQCSFVTRSTGSIWRHKLQHKEEKPLSCNQSSFATGSRGSLYHKLLHKEGEKRYSCNECGFKTNYILSLKQHKLRIHGVEKPDSSDQCGNAPCRVSNPKRQEKKHLKSKARHGSYLPKNKLKPIEPGMSTLFQCKDCGFNSGEERHFRQHRSEAGRDAANSKCQHCQKEFRFKGCLEYHSETSHGQEGNISDQGEDLQPPFKAIGFQCLYCEVISANVVSFLEHERTHPFPCPRCGTEFYQKSRLRQHKAQCPEVVLLN